jgi:hypothetical protein
MLVLGCNPRERTRTAVWMRMFPEIAPVTITIREKIAGGVKGWGHVS